MSKAVKARIVFLADDYAGYESRGLLGQHGLSVFIEVIDKDGKVHRVLFDTGQYADGIIHNANLLGVDLHSIDAIVLSHNHYDHTGGLLGILKNIGKRVPVVAHPDVFKPSIYIARTSVRLNIGVPFRRVELEEAGADFVLVKTPLEVAPGVFFLGEIERKHPDLAPVLRENYTIVNGVLTRHELRDDTGIVVVVNDVGAIVIGGCSHSGIINIVKTAEKITGEKPYAVMGGFHLLGFTEEEINNIIKLFREEGVEEVHAGHCTGLRAEYLFLKEYREKFAKLHSGHTAVFGGK